ncbi:MAG: hypothetical protein ACTSUN_09185 [Promethearchaeota archaeon]
MCNYCDCENMHLCSIVGTIPLGFCCPKCVYYNEEHTCYRSQWNVQSRIPSSLKTESGKIQLFPEKFCLKTARDTRMDELEEEEELEVYNEHQ